MKKSFAYIFAAIAFLGVFVSNVFAENGAVGNSSDGLCPITINGQPSNTEVFEGKRVSFSVAAKESNGKKLSYVWYVDRNNGKAVAKAGYAATLPVAASAAMDGYKYFCKISNGKESIESITAILSVRSLARITAQPRFGSVYDGQSAELGILATGYGLSYQWQKSANGRDWVNVGGNSAKLVLENIEKGDNNTRYRCIVSNSNGGRVVVSSVARLAVKQTVSVSRQPVDVSAISGSNAVFTIGAVGTAPIKYQWQISTDGGKTWENIAKAISSRLLLAKVQKDIDGTQYRCVATNGGGTAYSNAASLDVSQKTEIVAPKSMAVYVFEDSSRKISVVAKAEPPFVCVWKRKTPKERNWNEVSGAGVVFENVYSAESICKIDGASLTDNTKYRCEVFGIGETKATISKEFTVRRSIATDIKIDEKRTLAGAFDGDVKSVKLADAQAVFAVAAKGTGALKYQWEMSDDDGENWTKIAKATSYIYRTPRLSFTAGDFDKIYRCVVGAPAGDRVSPEFDIVRLFPVKNSDIEPLQNIKISDRETAVFEVKTSFDGVSKLSYLWQVSTDGGNVWKSAGSAKKILSVRNPRVASSGNLYRCLVSNAGNAAGAAAVSNSAELKVFAQAAIKAQPKSVGTVEGNIATLSCVVSGANTKYRWESSSDGKTWTAIEGETKSFFDYIAAAYGNVYLRCVAYSVDDDGILVGSEVASSKAKISVYQKVRLESITLEQSGKTDTNDYATAYLEYPAVLVAKATGYRPRYQWYKNTGDGFVAIRGATSNRLKLDTTVKALGEIGYKCAVQNVCGNGKSFDEREIIVNTVECPLPKILSGTGAELMNEYGIPTFIMAFPDASNVRIASGNLANLAFSNSRYTYRRLSPTSATLSLSYKEYFQSFDGGFFSRNFKYSGVAEAQEDGTVAAKLVNASDKSDIIEGTLEYCAGAAPTKPRAGELYDFQSYLGESLYVIDASYCEFGGRNGVEKCRYTYRRNGSVGVFTLKSASFKTLELALAFNKDGASGISVKSSTKIGSDKKTLYESFGCSFEASSE